MANINQEGAERVPEVSDDDIKIALDLESEGKEIPDSLKPALAQHKKDKAGDTGDNEPEAPSTGGAEEEEPKTDPKPEDSEDDDEDSDNGEDDGEDSKDQGDDGEGNDKNNKSDQEPPKKRPTKLMPVEAHTQIKSDLKEKIGKKDEEIAELKEQIENISKDVEVLSKEEKKKKMKELSDAIGLGEGDLGKLLEFIKGEISLPEGLADKLTPEIIDKLNQEGGKEETKEEGVDWDAQDETFNEEFNNTLEEDKNLDKELMSKHKDRIKDLAFTDGYNNKSVWEIWTRYVKPFITEKKKSIDHKGKTGGGSKTEKDWDEVAKDPEAIRNLSIEDAEKFQDHMAKKDRPKIRRA